VNALARWHCSGTECLTSYNFASFIVYLLLALLFTILSVCFSKVGELWFRVGISVMVRVAVSCCFRPIGRFII